MGDGHVDTEAEEGAREGGELGGRAGRSRLSSPSTRGLLRQACLHSPRLAGPARLLSAPVKCQCHLHVLQDLWDALGEGQLALETPYRRGGRQRLSGPSVQGTLAKEPLQTGPGVQEPRL